MAALADVELRNHARQNSGVFPHSQRISSFGKSLREKLDAVVQDALMASIGDEDKLCGFDDDSDHWAGHRLRVIRQTRGGPRGWNQDIFAGIVGRDRSTISDWERGKIAIDHHLLYRIQKHLRLEIIPFVLYGEWRYFSDVERQKILDRLEKLPLPEPWQEQEAQERK